MRKPSLLLALLTLCWVVSTTQGQDNPTTITFSKKRQFTIPFTPPQGKLRSLQLYVSSDQGRTWQHHATAAPEQGRFACNMDRDGYFWFAVQTIDMDNKAFPESMNGAQPSIKVVVDTQPPVVIVQPLAPRNGEVGVSWEIRDENPDMGLADALRLEYRPAGTSNWIGPMVVNPASKQHYWNPQTTALVEVRLRARDRAGNWGEASTTVSVTGSGGGSVYVPPTAPTEPQVPSDVERKFINSTKITLNYKLKDVGPSGVSLVELWFTLDGRTWNKSKYGSDSDMKSVTFDVVGEGLYGISLIARSGVGLGAKPPQTGDRPQVWLEVDTTKPVVQLHNVIVGQGLERGKMTITWSARDKNLQREPITISYAEQAGGPWTPIAEKLPNTGRYMWTIPEKIPFKFYVKVEAIDKALNVGEAITADLIPVDLFVPKAEIDNIGPAGK